MSLPPLPVGPRRERGAAPARERGLDTKERLLEAAERLFAERGFEGTSMRAVTQAARASVSAANYHFGSKEALLRATLLRRIEPVNRLRLAHLDALERGSGPGALALEQVLEAFLRPIFEERAASAAQLRQVAARLYHDPPELVASLKRELFGEILDRFTAAFARALPEHRPEEIELGFHFAIGAMVHVMGGHVVAEAQLERTPSSEEVLQRLVAFAAAGMRARSPAPGGGGGR